MLNKIDQDAFSSKEEMYTRIKNDLDTIGYIVITNTDIEVDDMERCNSFFVETSEAIGEPQGHDANGKIIWDIKSNASSKSFIKTYSEHNHEAQLHTDSQYSFYPEDYFGLLTLKKAECGGGISYLLSLEDILTELRQLPNGEEIIDTLSNTSYPFIVPNVFKQDDSLESEFNYGPILRENEIRFRIDTFEKALLKLDGYCSEKQLEAYQALKKIALESKNTKSFFLEEKDLIYINNKTMLHGRGQFTDNNRHLLRIRMNKFLS